MDVHEIEADARWRARPLWEKPAMSIPRLTLRNVEIRSVSIPLLFQKRQQLMEAWARFCVTRRSQAEVVSIGGQHKLISVPS